MTNINKQDNGLRHDSLQLHVGVSEENADWTAVCDRGANARLCLFCPWTWRASWVCFI